MKVLKASICQLGGPITVCRSPQNVIGAKAVEHVAEENRIPRRVGSHHPGQAAEFGIDVFDFDRLSLSGELGFPRKSTVEGDEIEGGKSADPYDTANAFAGIALKTGPPIENEALKPAVGKTIVDICPAAPGAKDWQPTAYSPRTKLIYVPHQHLCIAISVSALSGLTRRVWEFPILSVKSANWHQPVWSPA